MLQNNLVSIVNRPLARRVRNVSLLLLLSYGIILIVISALENRMVYLPRPWPDDTDFDAPANLHDVFITTEDGARLHSWYLEHPAPRGYVLFFHGNAGNLYGRRYRFLHLSERHQVSIFAMDYRGFGKSTGMPNETNTLSDARRARTEFARLAKISVQQITILGRSLGGGVAVDLAATEGCRGLILESTFTSLPDVAKRFYWWLPVRWLMRNRYESIDKIGRYSGPLIQCHAEGDSLVPIGLGRQLFEQAQAPKSFHAWPEIDHNDPHPDAYDALLESFFEQLAPLDSVVR